MNKLAHDNLIVNQIFPKVNNSPVPHLNLSKVNDQPSSPQSEVIPFLKSLFDHCEKGFINLRFLPSAKNLFIPLSEIDSIPTILESRKGKNIYFGVSTRVKRDGTKAGILEIPCLHVDVDFKGISLDGIERLLKDFLLKPTFIISSGGGLHLYFKLKELATRDDIPRIENLNRRLASYFHGDMNATDASRIMRLPGSINYKYPHRPVVTIESFHPNRDYDLSDFDFLPETKPVDRPLSSPIWLSNLTSDHNIEDFLDKAIATAIPGTRNSTGFVLARLLRDCGISFEEAVSFMVRYAKGVRKADHPYTVAEAMASLQQVYGREPREPSMVDMIRQNGKSVSQLFQESRGKDFLETSNSLRRNVCGKGTILVTSKNLESAIILRALCHKDSCPYCSKKKKNYWKGRIFKDFGGGAYISIIEPERRKAWKDAAYRKGAFGYVVYSGNTRTFLFISNVRVKDSFFVDRWGLDELLEKYFDKEESPMNGRRKADSFGFRKRKEKPQAIENKEERKLVFFIPHDLEEVLDANRAGLDAAGGILQGQIEDDEFEGDSGEVKKIIFSDEARRILKAISEGKIVPIFSLERRNPFLDAIFCGEI